MIFKNPKVQKFISSILIILVILPAVLFSRPKPAEAQVTDFLNAALKVIGNLFTGAGSGAQITETSYTIKQWAEIIVKQVLQAAARKVLQEVTKSTVNWINSGFHGSPLFLENPKSFFNDIAKSELKNMVDTFGYDRVKFPFGRDFALNTIATYKNTLENNTSYTLSNVIKDTTVLHNYQNDFNFGGWNGFLINTQYPQNNYLGFQMTATEELARKVQGTAQSAAQKVSSALQQGQGFLSPQKCMDEGTNYNNGVNEFQKPGFPEKKYRDEHPSSVCTDQDCLDRWARDYEKAKADWAKDNTCKNLVNTTPGSVASAQITKALGLGTDQATLAGAMGNSLSTIFDALLNKFIGDGLNALTSTTNPRSTPVDNWSYDGQTLGSPNDSDWASGPDQEIILRDLKILIDGKTIVTFKKGQQLFDEDGNLKVYGAGTPITCRDGDKIIDSEGNTIEFCTRGEAIYCKAGEKIVAKDNTSVNCVDTEDGIQRHSSDPARLDPVLAEGGEVVTLVGDKSLDSRGNTIEGREYFPGNLENTIKELALIDNPCEPSDTDCLSDPLKKTVNPETKNLNYTYRPGIFQLIPAVVQATKTLDQCIPGPDKGWELRLKEEQSRVERQMLDNSTGDGSDDIKNRAASATIKELKFAVTSFRDWVEIKIMKELNGAMVYVNAVQEIDNFTQNIKELTDAKREKVKALGRLEAINTELKSMAEQPEPGSLEEKTLITLKKQYDAVRPSLSSVTSIENSQNQLNLLKGQYQKLTYEDNRNPAKPAPSLITKCMEQRRTKGWEEPDPSGKGGLTLYKDSDGVFKPFGRNPNYAGKTVLTGANPYTTKNPRTLTTVGSEIEQFCSAPIVNGYSHGEVVRNDSTSRENNCFKTPEDCNYPEYDTSGWFTFRNQGVDHDITTFRVIPAPKQDSDDGYGPYYKDMSLPLVNADGVFGDLNKSGSNTKSYPKTDVNMSCVNIFRARTTDYTSAGDINDY